MMRMPEYLSPSIGMVIPQLEQACEDLIRQSLIRSLTDYTKQLCEYDPELADILLEGKKTLPRCIRYVMEKAQNAAAQQLESMAEEEVSALQEVKVRDQTARMMGVAISDEQVYQWAQKYYYGGAEEEPSKITETAKTADASKKKGKASAKPGKEKETAKPKETASQKETAPAEASQISLFSAA